MKKNTDNNSTLVNTIHMETDIIEVHKNKNLTKNPYLIRVFSYNNNDPDEFRCEESEVKNLYNTLKKRKLL